jgi:hypothetical protein
MKNMGIDHGGHHVAVRQQLLGRADIIRELQQVNGERPSSPARSTVCKGSYCSPGRVNDDVRDASELPRLI